MFTQIAFVIQILCSQNIISHTSLLLHSCHYMINKNVASCFLNKVPGRSGVITILGKECEVKASEPKTHQDEFADRSRDAYNYGKPRPMIVNSKLPSLQQSSSSSSHPGWFDLMPSTHQPTLQTQSPQQKNSSMFANNSSGSGFGGGGNTLPGGGNTFPHQLHVNQALLIPPTIDNGGGRGSGGVSIYSHSTITRSSNNTGASQEDGDTTVYIQNNFYLLPPGSAMTVPPNHANTVSPERLQAKQLAEFSRVATPVQQYAVSSSLHPSYPGPRNVSNDEKDWAAAATAASAAGGGRHVSFSPPKEASSYDIWQQKY